MSEETKAPMSAEEIKKLSMEEQKKRHVPEAEMKAALSSTIYQILMERPFFGSVLQCMEITWDHTIPTAGVMFDAADKKWKMYISPFFFVKCLNTDQRMAVLLHEIFHITHKHPLRVPFMKLSNQRRQFMNVAMDMAINQYIKNLPKGCDQCPPDEAKKQGAQCTNETCPGGCIDVADFYDEDKDDKTGQITKTPWPVHKTAEWYYEKLIQRFVESDEEQDGEGEGEGSGIPKPHDQHNWDASGEESDMLDATEELVQRALQKASMDHNNAPGHIKELLADIEARRAELNYKGIIRSVIKRSASGLDRKKTWSKTSKRFGWLAPGSKIGDLPKLDMYCDSSGSISVQEANDMLSIIDEFLRNGSRKCGLRLWHTSVYYEKEYKLGNRIGREEWHSGGTDVEPTLKHVFDKKPDLAIIYTDGYYSDVDFNQWLKPGQKPPQVLWIITKDGNAEHPLRRLGKTIKIPN